MNTAQHTPGFAEVSTLGSPRADVRIAGGGRAIATTWGLTGQAKTPAQYERKTATDRANARRIVACWNACIDLSTEDLEAVVAWRAACKKTAQGNVAARAEAHAIGDSHPDAIRHFVDQLSEEFTGRRPDLEALLREARKIVRASSSRHLAKDWDRRTTDALADTGSAA